MSSTGHLSELDLLRGQVADLSRWLAERDRSAQDIQKHSDLLRAIVEGTAAETGEEFFASLVIHLTSLLKVQYAVIGEVQGDRIKKIRTLAVSAGGALVDNFEYELTGTPCQTALAESFACFKCDVRTSFPEFQRLADLGAESYCAVSLRAKSGAVIGLLIVMDTKPLERNDDLQSLLGVFAPRIAAEFERRRAEQERAQTQADLYNVMESVPDILFTLDCQGNMVKWNRRVKEVTGYSQEELLNKSAMAFVPPEERDSTAAAIQRAFTEGYAELEGHLLTKGHRLIPYHWTGALLKNFHGEPIGITGVGRDVSDKKRAEEALKRQRRHLVDAQALAHLGSWEWELDSGEVQWSDEQYRIFGHEPGAIAVTDDTFLTSLHPDDNDRALAAINDALLGKRPCDVECRIVRPNGDVRFIHVRGDVDRDAAGHLISMAGTVLDITERKQGEESLRASEERWQLAVHGSNDGIWDWNIQTGEVFFSARWKAMRGYEEFELADSISEWQGRIHPDDIERVLHCIDQYLAKQRPQYCEEYRAERKDGSYMWILDRGMALWANDGTPLRMAGSETDITARKQTEEALAYLAATLEQQVSEQTEALRVSEARFRQFFDHAPNVTFLKTSSGHYLYTNRQFEKAFGLSPGGAWGKTDAELFSPQQASQSHMHDQQVLASGQAQEFEETVQHQDGLHTNIVMKFPLIDASGRQTAIGGIATDITQRKRTQEQLALYREIFAQSIDGIAVIDLQGRYLEQNTAHEQMLGYSHDLLADKTPAVHLGEEAFARVGRELAESGVYCGELQSRTARGEALIINLDAFVVKDTERNPLCYVGIKRDITDRKLAEEALAHFAATLEQQVSERTESLRVSEERYARATAIGRVGVWELDVATGTYYGDVNLKALFGYTKDELSTDPYVWLNLVHPDDQSIALDHWQRIVSGEIDDYNYELRMLKKDGTIIWTDVRGHAARDREGQVTHLFGATVDITERKQAQDALVQSERQLRTVLDTLPVGVWFTDRSGKVILSNPAANQIWSNIKQIGLQVSNDQPGWWETTGSANEPHRWALSQVLTTGIPSLNEIFNLECLDGTRRVIRNSTVPVQDEAGVILGAIVLNEDITLLRQAQSALQLTQFSVDHAIEGFFWIGSDAGIFHVNDAACRLLEYTYDELTTMTVHDIDPNFSSEVWPAHWEELKEKGSLTFESTYWSRTGRVLDMEVTVNYLQYEGKEYNCTIMRDIGERKWVEGALRESEERYRSLYDETPTMYFTLATDGRMLSVNRFGAEQLGYQVDELVGNSVMGLFHEGDKQTVAAGLSECLATPETTRHWEFRKVRKDGSVIWVRETVRVSRSSTGETVVLVTCEDITERKQAEHESHMRAAETLAMQRTLLELAHLDDTKLTFSEVVPRVTKLVADTLAVERASLWLLSEDRTELVCQDLYERSHAVHSTGSRLRALNYPRYFSAIEDSLVVAASDALVDPRTSEFAEGYLLPLGIASMMDVAIHRQGTLIGVVCYEHVGSPREWSPEAQSFAASVSESVVRILETAKRKQVEEALKASEQRLRDILDSMFAFVGLFSADGIVLEANRAPLEATGLTREEVIGRPFADLYCWSYSPAIQAELRAALSRVAQGETVRYDVPIQVRNEQQITIDMVFVPLFNEQGRVTQIVGSAVDITDRKRMEETLRQRERDLRVAIEERERISQDLHDGILQSLFAVGLTLEASKSTMSPAVRKTSGSTLDLAIGQLNDVMREIRNFIAGLGSDLLQGKDMPTVLKHMLASLTENQATRVRLAVEDRAAKALSTEQSLHLIRVIQEAVSNCIKHGHAPEARVSLKMLKQGVRLSIRDNGCGFNQGAAKKTGHGLVNMAARAQKIGGRFTVLSKVNEGTSIVLDLPNEAADVRR